MTKRRNVKTHAAALALGRSAGDALPKRAREPMSIADALENPVSGLGTRRDKRSFSNYGIALRMADQDLRTMFRKSWLASAIVSTPVEDMTREWVTVKWEGMDGKAEKALQRAQQRLGLKRKTQSALTWARLLAGGVIIPIFVGDDPSLPLDLNTIRKGSLRKLIVKDRTWVYPMSGAPDRDIEGSDNFGMPLYYGVRGSSVRFHASRIIRFEGREVPEDDFLTNGYWHDSELQHVVTATMDYDGGTENVASLLWEAKIDVIKTALAAMIAKKDRRATVEQRYVDAAEGKSNHRLLLINEDESYEQKNVSFTGIRDVLGHFVVNACGAARIPMVKLFGQSAPGLNSTGENDLRLYYDRIAAEAERVMIPPLLYVMEMIVRSELGLMPEGFDVCANPLWQIDDTAQSTIDVNRATMDDKYLQRGVITPGLVARELQARGTYKTITDDDVKLAESMEEPLPTPAPNPQPPANEPAPPAP